VIATDAMLPTPNRPWSVWTHIRSNLGIPGVKVRAGWYYPVWMIDPHPIRKRFASLCPHLSERERRLYAAAEARAAGYGGIAAVSAATGITVSTIGRGLKELAAPDTLDPDRVRRPGGGRKLLVEKDATLLDDLLALVEPSEHGEIADVLEPA